MSHVVIRKEIMNNRIYIFIAILFASVFTPIDLSKAQGYIIDNMLVITGLNLTIPAPRNRDNTINELKVKYNPGWQFGVGYYMSIKQNTTLTISILYEKRIVFINDTIYKPGPDILRLRKFKLNFGQISIPIHLQKNINNKFGLLIGPEINHIMHAEEKTGYIDFEGSRKLSKDLFRYVILDLDFGIDYAISKNRLKLNLIYSISLSSKAEYQYFFSDDFNNHAIHLNLVYFLTKNH